MWEDKPSARANIHPDHRCTFVAMSEHTGLSISQVTDEVLYVGLLELQVMDELVG